MCDMRPTVQLDLASSFARGEMLDQGNFRSSKFPTFHARTYHMPFMYLAANFRTEYIMGLIDSTLQFSRFSNCTL